MYKLLIVDDEPFVRYGIRKMTEDMPEWEIAGEAGNGRQAIAYLERTKVDLVLCDIRMPDCDGIEFIRRIRAQGNDIPVVFLTGHPDFEYAQQALRHDALDYLLKPCLAKDIRQVLEKAETLLARRRQLDRHAEYSAELAVRRLLYGEQAYEDADEDLPAWLNEHDAYRVASLDGSQANGAGEAAFMPAELMSASGRRLLFKDGPSEYALLVADEPEGVEALRALCRRSGGRLRAGLGDSASAYALARSYRQSKLALGLANREKPVVEYGELARLGGVPVAMTLELEMELLQAVRRGNVGEAEACLDKLREAWTGMPERELGHRLYTLYNQLHSGSGLFPTADEPTRPLQQLLEKSDSAGMMAQFSELVKRLGLQIRQQTAAETHYTVQRAVRAIHERFRDNITLKEIAAELSVSPAYLSVLFKQETNQTFSDYLIGVRMKEAMKKMRDTTMKIYEIAQDVGYVDGRHFSQVFKQTTGLTPQEYRNRNG